jgi:hypothetical protein
MPGASGFATGYPGPVGRGMNTGGAVVFFSSIDASEDDSIIPGAFGANGLSLSDVNVLANDGGWLRKGDGGGREN